MCNTNEITLVIVGNKVDLEKKRVIGNQSVILRNNSIITLVIVGNKVEKKRVIGNQSVSLCVEQVLWIRIILMRILILQVFVYK